MLPDPRVATATLRSAAYGFVAAALPGVLVVVCEARGLGSWGYWLFLVTFLVALLGVASALELASEKRRARALRTLCFCVAFAAVAYGALRLSRGARRAAFLRLAERSEPLVAAIKRHEATHGSPPKSLAELVPSLLDRVPETGMPAHPKYEYGCWETDSPRDAAWELRVHCGTGPLNWDSFFYWPTEQYPRHIYGGSVERIGNWAYVHE